jgi:SAM-dependent methyltransferase
MMQSMEGPGPGTYAWDNGWVEARRRLDLLEQCFDPASRETLASVGVQPGWHCLEVGGGGGSIVRWLCDAVGPGGSVVTIDLDTRFLREIDAPHLEVIEADMVTEGLPPGPFDLIHSRAVLMHIPARDRLLGELVDRLRPGGLMVLEECDFHSIGAAESRLYQAFIDDFARIVEAEAGLSTTWARSLPARFEALGLSGVGCRATTRIFPGGSPDAEFFRITYLQTRDLLLANGVTKEAFDAFLALFDDNTQWLPAPAVVAAIGRRP